MPTWMTAAQLADRYAVGEDRLIAYSRRGNLPFRQASGGDLVFDEAFVARFFRPRGPLLVVAQPSRGPSLGLLGVARLGDKPIQSASNPFAAEAKLRPLRPAPRSRQPVGELSGLANTGTGEG
ncbi:MAG: hypothetical protein MUF34_33190 [Polyangiaceae bacterium]|jgi:hypothetical protein|nr:hypothetical protein [Polyangiaceae bacterium]